MNMQQKNQYEMLLQRPRLKQKLKRQVLQRKCHYIQRMSGISGQLQMTLFISRAKLEQQKLSEAMSNFIMHFASLGRTQFTFLNRCDYLNSLSLATDARGFCSRQFSRSWFEVSSQPGR